MQTEDKNTSPENPVLIAVVGAPHGIRGEVRMKTFTGDPMAIGDYGPLQGGDGRRFQVKPLRLAKSVVVARIKGIADRTAAEALRGVELFVDRSALPDDLEEDEYYFSDLVGLSAHDRTGTNWGKVIAVHDYGGGDLLELAVPGRGAMLIPFTGAAVPEVDIEHGQIIVEPLAAGLVDGPSDEPDQPET